MSSSLFHVQQHTLPAQHIRHYPYATLHEDEEILHLAIKQYTPLSNRDAKRGDVTIIATHANGLPKELYEPLWDELLQQSEKQGWRIRSIWIADMSNQGWSGVLNEEKLGCEQTLVLIDPVAAPLTKGGGEWGVAGEWGVLAASSFRRDRWPSREAAERSFKKNKFYQAWDPRVMDRLVEYELRETPTKLYPDSTSTSEDIEVTLTTTKHQEIFSFSRTYRPERPGDPPHDLLHPEARMYDNHGSPAPFYRAESHITFNNLPFLRPSVMYIFGEHSELMPWAKAKIENTGTADIGSGGVKAGKVEEITIMGTGHLIPMEKVEETATHSSRWISDRLSDWMKGEAALKEYWDSVPEKEKYTLNADYYDGLKPPGKNDVSKL